MNTAEFDRAMAALARAEATDASDEKLRRTLRSLPDAPRARTPRLRLVPVLAALLLISGAALAAQLGFLSFWQNNPYNFFHNRQSVQPQINVTSFAVTDGSDLRLLRAEPLDSAWIEGRLTLTLRLTAEKALIAGERGGDSISVYGHVGDAAQTLPLNDVGLVLYAEDTICAADGWSAFVEFAECENADGGVTLAMQLPADFITASDLPALTDADGMLALRLTLNVYDPSADAFSAESVSLAVAAPTEEERTEMDP